MFSINPRHLVYLAICWIVLGFSLILTHDSSPLDVVTGNSGSAQVTVIDLSKPRNNGNHRLYVGMGLIGLGLLLGARNLTIKNNQVSYSASDLTPKEQEILADIQKGLTNKEIAQQHHISLSTVKTHVSNIYKKYQVNSRAELLAKAI